MPACQAGIRIDDVKGEEGPRVFETSKGGGTLSKMARNYFISQTVGPASLDWATDNIDAMTPRLASS